MHAVSTSYIFDNYNFIINNWTIITLLLIIACSNHFKRAVLIIDSTNNNYDAI